MEQLDGSSLLTLLHIDADASVQAHCRQRFSVSREHDIAFGRLDVVVSFSRDVILVVEVKTSSADEAETAKQQGYSEWLAKQPHLHKLRPILIAVDAEKEDYEGFVPLRWADVCLGLRAMFPMLMIASG